MAGYRPRIWPLGDSALVAGPFEFNRYIQDLSSLWATSALIDSVMLAKQPGFGWHAWKRLLLERRKHDPTVEFLQRVPVSVLIRRAWDISGSGVTGGWSNPWESRDPYGPHASFFTRPVGIKISSYCPLMTDKLIQIKTQRKGLKGTVTWFSFQIMDKRTPWSN